MSNFENFRNHVIECGYILDAEGTHSEFVSGKHGQKLDFDQINERVDPLYGEWIDVNEAFLRQQYDPLPEVLVGVANGTNRVSVDTARRFNGEMLGLESRKDQDNSKVLYLTSMAARVIQVLQPALTVIVEDVGTTGSNSVQIAVQAREAGAQRVEVITTWKRRSQLEQLDKAGIVYRAIIDESLPTFDDEECRTLPEGFCARGWKFKPRER